MITPEQRKNHIPRHPYHVLKRALQRADRLATQINRTIEKDPEPSKIDQLFRIFFDNEELIETLKIEAERNPLQVNHG